MLRPQGIARQKARPRGLGIRWAGVDPAVALRKCSRCRHGRGRLPKRVACCATVGDESCECARAAVLSNVNIRHDCQISLFTRSGCLPDQAGAKIGELRIGGHDRQPSRIA